MIAKEYRTKQMDNKGKEKNVLPTLKIAYYGKQTTAKPVILEMLWKGIQCF